MFGKGGHIELCFSAQDVPRIDDNERDSHDKNKYSVGAFEITNYIPLQFT